MATHSAEEIALAEAIEALYIQAKPRSKKRGHPDTGLSYPEWFQVGRPRRNRGYPDLPEPIDPVAWRQRIYPEMLQELLIDGSGDVFTDPVDIFYYSVRGYDVEFAHYFPWFLEQIARNREFAYEADTVFRKFREAKWQEWPEAERIKVQNFMRALWCVFLVKDVKEDDEEDEEDDDWNAGEVLDWYAEAVDDLQEFLDIWHHYCALCCIPAWEKLIQFIENSWALWPESKDDRHKGRCGVTSWLLHPDTTAAFQRIYSQHAQEPCANSMATVIGYLAVAIKSGNLEGGSHSNAT